MALTAQGNTASFTPTTTVAGTLTGSWQATCEAPATTWFSLIPEIARAGTYLNGIDDTDAASGRGFTDLPTQGVGTVNMAQGCRALTEIVETYEANQRAYKASATLGLAFSALVIVLI